MVTSDNDTLHDRFARETGLAAAIADIVEPVLVDLGFRLVQVKISGRESPVVQVMAERDDGMLSISECEKISRQLSPVLDVADPMSSPYRLEVSSPGIDRPLVRPIDFIDWAGYEAKIELDELVDGRKRFRGHLDGFSNAEARIEVDLDQIGLTVLGLPVALISQAHLVLTDELIREALTRAKKHNKEAGRPDEEQPAGKHVED